MPAITLKKIIVIKVFIVIILLVIFVAGATSRYINISKHAEASQCRRNQVIVETALAIAYAESLAVGSHQFPRSLEPSMFEDGQIPTCPIDGTPIIYDRTTGTAFCPNHIEEHERIY
ncbi:hypothetical protein JXB12_03445 [candidate division KSB1 bacterium]|nr:hypothetical protein [candidate division KSB1 bacterium]